MDNTIQLEQPERDEVMRRLRSHFQRELDEPPGDLWVMLLYDFIAEEIAPFFYNAGLGDAQRYLARFVDSLDADLDAAKRLPPRAGGNSG